MGPAGSLEVVVEKDFACLDRSDEGNSDNFANPLAGAVATVDQSVYGMNAH